MCKILKWLNALISNLVSNCKTASERSVDDIKKRFYAD